MAALSCQQVALIFTACVAPGLASRNQFQLAMMKEAPSPAPAGSPASAPGPAPLGPCECRFEDFCTCEGALRYLDCISQTCAKEECHCSNNTVQFSTSCGQMASECKEDLDIQCSSSKATCEGKFNQAANGIIGLTMEFDKIASDAFCGPTGRCAGTISAAVKVHKPAKGVRVSCALEPRQGHSLVLQQSNSLRKPSKAQKLRRKEAKAEAEKQKAEAEKDEKETKKVTKAKDEKGEEDKEKDEDGKNITEVGSQEHFGITGLTAHEKGLLTCQAEVKGDEATCTMDMPLRLKPEGDIEGLCRLVEEATDEIITKDAWFVVKNAYEKPKAKAEPKKMEAPKSGSVLTSCSLPLAMAALAAIIVF
eukprot:gnl/MRDRNA2_/MRDRNA2_87732_c0_seq1.p1 gnl/MRDRNA2_/MRDRNA2_87732_c0~~gnl/MRDRNA2_/MRDRNA2_87732_c0_seq1.p1  ORF type:complete len:364 (-),score=94.61 gnl/MRDRNA2_/MRDRNA2_87732_c0_seq1:30-1121(-)